MSAKGSAYWDNDDSGIGVQPRKGSNVRPEHRVHFWGVNMPKTFLAGQHLVALNERFIMNLRRQLDMNGMQEHWVELLDLYSFVQLVMGRAQMETVMGPKLLELNPTFVEDFCVYDNNLIKIMFGWPRWLAPSAYRIRDRLRAALVKWRDEAQKEAALDVDNPGIAQEDPEFDPYYGSKLIRAQRAATIKMGLDDEDSASLDMSLLFA